MLTIELKSEFCDLAGQLSPENLSCDGELSRAQVNKRYTALMKQWRALEKQAGQSVSEDDAWNWWDEVRAHHKAQEAKIIAAEPSHPLLAHHSRGVWKRLGRNGMSAYYIQGPGCHCKEEYNLYSEFAWALNGQESLGRFTTLEAAVAEGERFLKTVTRDTYRAAKPNWNLSIIDRELERLPRDRNLFTICADAEMNRQVLG